MTVREVTAYLLGMPPDALVAIEEPRHGQVWSVNSIEYTRGDTPRLLEALVKGLAEPLRSDVVLLKATHGPDADEPPAAETT